MDSNQIEEPEVEIIDQTGDVERGRSTPSRRGLFPTWGDLLAFLGLFFLGQVVARLATSMIITPEDVAGYQIFIYSIISLPLTFIFIIIYRLFRSGAGRDRRIVRMSMRGLDPTILLWGVVMLLSMVVVIEPLMTLLPETTQTTGRGVYMLITVSVVAPIFEELICRGVILESIRSKRGAWAACVISALIFGVIHISPQSMLNAFVIGLLLGFLYLRTNSIIAPIVIHSLNNLLSYLLLIMGISELTLSELVKNHTLYMIIYIIACGVLLFSFIGVSRYINAVDSDDRKVKQ
ncbi:MAG: CPBP family intramembrane glutamic endopeptidase [Rikenellaceae bacterium]